MPRTSVWFNERQLAEVRQTFGDGVNLSGVVRAGLGVLLSVTHGPRGDEVKAEVSLISSVSEVMDRAEALLGKAERAKAERAAR